jgi:ABC-type nitrate/sulfonate/bicarbonate transport system permease component
MQPLQKATALDPRLKKSRQETRHHAQYETLLAFGISIPLGIMLAGLMVYSRLAYQALYPNIVFFQLIPGFKQPAHRNLRVSEGVKNLLR